MPSTYGDYGTAIWKYWEKDNEELVLSDWKAAFCSGQVTTAKNELLVFGGHGEENDLARARHYSSGDGTMEAKRMPSGRWYPTAATMPDGNVLVSGTSRGVFQHAAEVSPFRHGPATGAAAAPDWQRLCPRYTAAGRGRRQEERAGERCAAAACAPLPRCAPRLRCPRAHAPPASHPPSSPSVPAGRLVPECGAVEQGGERQPDVHRVQPRHPVRKICI